MKALKRVGFYQSVKVIVIGFGGFGIQVKLRDDVLSSDMTNFMRCIGIVHDLTFYNTVSCNARQYSELYYDMI